MIKTVTLSGSEMKITGLGGFSASVLNNGASTVYVSAEEGVVAGADGVMPVAAGMSVILPDCNGTVYALGTGDITLVGSAGNTNFFKPLGAGSSGGTVDEVARAAIEAHVSNSDIHHSESDIRELVLEVLSDESSGIAIQATL